VRLNETIAALSSNAAAAARMIVRASGPQAHSILNQLCSAQDDSAARTRLSIDGMSVPVWVYRFVKPRSYTGDDLFELHLPGNPLLAGMVLDRIIQLGARRAEPGEFTARAYFNGRIDLSQAEGVAAVVAAANEAELNAGRMLMSGELARRLRPCMEQLANCLALIEAEIDFSDQGTRFVSDEQLAGRLADVERNLSDLLSSSGRLARLSHEPRLVLAGRPNAGKSTLLNALSKSARAVVSPVAGTTRDALTAQVALDRGIVRLVDVAGIETEPGRVAPVSSEIETQMQQRALTELERADAVILVRDATDSRPMLDLPRKTDLIVWTKIDLNNQAIPKTDLGVSAPLNLGMDKLRSSLDSIAFGARESSSTLQLALTNRHIQAISAGRDAVARARLENASEILAAELRSALDSLGQICGDVTPDDILGRIFATFCIGK
jgi:tRNA modification GTPase